MTRAFELTDLRDDKVRALAVSVRNQIRRDTHEAADVLVQWCTRRGYAAEAYDGPARDAGHVMAAGPWRSTVAFALEALQDEWLRGCA